MTLRLSHFCAGYGRVSVVRDINLEIGEGTDRRPFGCQRRRKDDVDARDLGACDGSERQRPICGHRHDRLVLGPAGRAWPGPGAAGPASVRRD